MLDGKTLIILVAPNVGEQMGGEAIKALQIFREVKKLHANTIQITHERNLTELSARLQMRDVHYVADTRFSVFLWRSRIFRWFVNFWFSHQAIKLADSIAEDRGLRGKEVIIHQTEPNSPVLPRATSRVHPNIFGPINGNIYYPTAFRRNETISARFRRLFHIPIQKFNRLFFKGLASADMILCAGGERTKTSLLMAGCRESILVDTVDCGVDDEILDRPRLTQSGKNFRIVHFGRLVFHKGTSLIIRALTKTREQIVLDVIGTGPELEACKTLVHQLNLTDRVKFIGWFPRHRDLLDTFHQYRTVLLPSIEDANGIVVQEAMALGLPCVCLNWGGPQLLIENEVSGFLIEPKSREFIVDQIAARLDQLAIDEVLAEKLSIGAKHQAEIWRWSQVAGSWIHLYSRVTDGWKPRIDRRRRVLTLNK